MVPLQIVRVESHLVYTELPRDFRISHGVDTKRRGHVILAITASDGDGELTGWGEASPLTFFTGETAESVRFVIDAHLGPLLVGQDARAIRSIVAQLERVFPHHPSSLTAIDMALHDLRARAAGQTLAASLGATVTSVLVYKAVGIGSPEETAADARRLLDAGFRALKIKVGLDWRADVARTEAVRSIAGAEVPLCADANEGFGVADAIRYAREASLLGVAYLEQPVPGWNVEGMREVRSHGGIAVMADEALRDLRSAARLLEANAADLFGIKLVKSGGLLRARQIADLAEAYGVPCVVISPFDTVLGASANLAFAATLPGSDVAHGVGTAVVASGDPFGRLDFVDGRLAIPSAPGMGFVPREVVAA